MSTIGKHDPMLREVLNKISDLTAAQIERKSGVTANTIRNWRNGKTKRPLSITLDFALRAAGYHRVIMEIRPRDDKR